MTFDAVQFVTVGLNGLTQAALYFIVASGFTLIFGLMRTVNMAHGALYLLGAYLGYSIGAAIGPGWEGWVGAIVGAFVTSAIVTPSIDPITQTLVAGPMIVLYFVGILLAKLVEKNPIIPRA